MRYGSSFRSNFTISSDSFTELAYTVYYFLSRSENEWSLGNGITLWHETDSSNEFKIGLLEYQP
jgi:hypothetical protein